MLKVNVRGFEWNQCSNMFRTHGVNLGQNQICAGGEKDEDSCVGDSGGPLMAIDDSNQRVRYHFQYIAGVVSFGAGCGQHGWPAVYTRVDQFMDWILSHMEP